MRCPDPARMHLFAGRWRTACWASGFRLSRSRVARASGMPVRDGLSRNLPPRRSETEVHLRVVAIAALAQNVFRIGYWTVSAIVAKADSDRTRSKRVRAMPVSGLGGVRSLAREQSLGPSCDYAAFPAPVALRTRTSNSSLTRNTHMHPIAGTHVALLTHPQSGCQK